MLIDTHCHINMMIKKTFDVPLEQQNINDAAIIMQQAEQHQVTSIINVGTSLVESKNCITLAQTYTGMYAAVGIHPNDCTSTWQQDFQEIKKLVANAAHNKIIGIGETGLDRHYPGYDIERQKDAFKAHIELALEYRLPLIVHTRDAHDEVLTVIDEYKDTQLRGVIHCFSENLAFAHHAQALQFVIGLGGTITYPKNNELRSVCSSLPLTAIVLETDAPFLPPQSIRGKQNHPGQIATIAEYIAQLRGISLHEVAQQTTATARSLFNI